MPNNSPLHKSILDRFRAALGEPHRTAGADHQWSLRQLSYLAPITVLINGSSDPTIVWVFDPHDQKDGVTHTTIQQESEIAPILSAIESRVRRASRPDFD